jgi:hypothetical protein
VINNNQCIGKEGKGYEKCDMGAGDKQENRGDRAAACTTMCAAHSWFKAGKSFEYPSKWVFYGKSAGGG